MSISILDGLGSGREAGVDQRNRMIGAVLSETESNYHTTLGLKYNVNTGDIVLNSAAKVTTLYFKNNDNRDVVIDNLVYNLGSNSGGSGDILIDVIRNPTQGDIITNANNVAVGTGIEANLNYGSSLFLDADIYKGAAGETPVTDGLENVLTRRSSPSGAIFISPGGGIILPKGNAVAFNFTPAAGTLSQTVQFVLNVYVKEF
jgi:hypothetical protein